MGSKLSGPRLIKPSHTSTYRTKKKLRNQLTHLTIRCSSMRYRNYGWQLNSKVMILSGGGK